MMGAAGAATRVARWTALRLFSLLLTPLLIVAGAFAVLASTHLINAVRFHVSIPSSIHVVLPQSRIPVFAAGAAALVLGLVFSITLARFLRLLPLMRQLIVVLEAVLLAVLLVMLFADNYL